MVVDQIKIEDTDFEVSVVKTGPGTFEVATIWDGNVLGMSSTRCAGLVEVGQCVESRVNRLSRLGCPNSHEASEMISILTRQMEELQKKLDWAKQFGD